MQNSHYTLLIVEDDAAIASLLAENLERWGFSVVCADDFSDVISTFRRVKPHLTLMDISLPQYNGYYWCTEIRKESQTPILFLSSHTESADVVMAVGMGGDDYVTKPFSMDVLIAKISALMRRAYSYYTEAAQIISARGVIMNIADGSLQVNGQTLALTRNESRMLRELMMHKNSIVTRDALMRSLWEDEHFIDENTLTVNINRLRRKLSSAGVTDFVQTRKGQGYIISD